MNNTTTTNSATRFQSIRRSAVTLLMAGGLMTSVVEAAAIVGTAAILPVAMHLGTSTDNSQSAVAKAHAAREARANTVMLAALAPRVQQG